MAYPVQLTLGTSNKVSVNYQSQDVNVSVTYQLERDEDDLLAVARDKADEVVAAQQALWERVRGESKNADASPQKTEVTGGEVANREVTEAQLLVTSGEKELSTLPLTPLSGGQLNAIEALLVQAGWSQSKVEEHLLDQFSKAEVSELSAPEAAQLLVELQRDERQRIQAKSQTRRQAPSTRNGRQ